MRPSFRDFKEYTLKKTDGALLPVLEKGLQILNKICIFLKNCGPVAKDRMASMM